jgi:CRP-like cAMP-binding protein
MRKDSPYYLPSIQVLQGAALFKGVDEEMLDEILGHFVPMTLPKKSIISSEQTAESLFVIIGGRVKISQVNPETGREYVIYVLERGDVFDIISLLENREHHVIFEVIDELQLLKTSAQTARDWLDMHPEFNKNFLPYIGKMMHLLEDKAVDMALYDTATRLTRLILHYVEDADAAPKKEYEVKLISDLSHEALAQMIGSVRKVVNIHIQELKKEGIIRSARGRLAVRNLQKLLEKAKADMPE